MKMFQRRWPGPRSHMRRTASLILLARLGWLAGIAGGTRLRVSANSALASSSPPGKPDARPVHRVGLGARWHHEAFGGLSSAPLLLADRQRLMSGPCWIFSSLSGIAVLRNRWAWAGTTRPSSPEAARTLPLVLRLGPTAFEYCLRPRWRPPRSSRLPWHCRAENDQAVGGHGSRMNARWSCCGVIRCFRSRPRTPGVAGSVGERRADARLGICFFGKRAPAARSAHDAPVVTVTRRGVRGCFLAPSAEGVASCPDRSSGGTSARKRFSALSSPDHRVLAKEFPVAVEQNGSAA